MDQDVIIVDGTGREHIFPAGFDPQKAAAIVRGQVGGGAETPTRGGGVLGTMKDLAIGAAKGIGSSIASIGETAVDAGMIPGVMPSMFQSQMRHPAFTKADEATTASNTPQRIGKVGAMAAEAVMPGKAVASAVPRAGRAASKLQRVMTAAKDAPVNVEAPGQVALRIQQLAERGGTMPRMVGRLLQRTTDPTKGPLNFEEGRDFYSNISRLSGDEYNRLTGPIKHEVGNLRTALNDALTQSADTVGMGKDYASGIKEYAQASKMNARKDALVKFLLQKGLPTVGAAGLGAGAAKSLGWFD